MLCLNYPLPTLNLISWWFLCSGELTILTGPTGCGKTTFLSQISLDLAQQVLFSEIFYVHVLEIRINGYNNGLHEARFFKRARNMPPCLLQECVTACDDRSSTYRCVPINREVFDHTNYIGRNQSQFVEQKILNFGATLSPLASSTNKKVWLGVVGGEGGTATL